MGIKDRLGRLEDRYGEPLCEERPPCRRRIATVEVVRYPGGGLEDRIGDPAPPLCATCPERDNPTPRIRTIVVVRAGPDGAEAY